MTPIDQLTQDLVTAQAEIARKHSALLEAKQLIMDINGKTYEFIEQALSQSSPSLALQEYRDMKADAERYRYIRNTVSANYGKHDGYSFALPWLNTKVNLMKGSVAGHLDTAIDAMKG